MFKDYVVMISGATSGLGLATAKEFLSQGANVIGLGRNFERTKDLGDHFHPIKCDVTDEEQIKAAVNYVKENFGRLDTLICNAGGGLGGTVETITSEELQAGYEVYFRHNVLLTKYSIPLLRKSKNPSITHTASAAGIVIGDNVPYNVMKAAVINYGRHSAAGLLNNNAVDMFGRPKENTKLEEGDNSYIRVNVICPGLVRSNILPPEVWDSFETEEVLSMIPCRRIGEDWEVAKLFAFLASPKATFITGATITIDGGWCTTHPRA
jgi:NAD(P)-dependent dehydrogenase (short-subunit alcohol dehydrogenase family)